MTSRAFPDPRSFAFVPALEAEFGRILAELHTLEPGDFCPSPDSLTTVRDGYDERGWRSFGLYGEEANGEDAGYAANRARCPSTARACALVGRPVNAGFSLFRPGTHLYPHRGELPGVLRCHLPLVVPVGDLGLRSGEETRHWEPGRCLILDDTFEHEAWNHADGDRVVLIVTFVP